MQRPVRFLCLLCALCFCLSFGILNAQQNSPSTPPATQPPDAEAQQAANPDQTQPPTTTTPAPPPSSSSKEAQSSKPSNQTGQSTGGTPDTTQARAVQSFSGTVTKSGDKYVLQDEASGKTYDVDHQDEVQKFEGKRVRVKGILDASGNMIYLQ